MADKFKPYKVTEDQVNSIPVKNGQVIFTTDTKKIYLDSGNARIEYIERPQQVYVEAMEPGDAEDGDVWFVEEVS